MKLKTTLTLIILLSTNVIYGQTDKDSLLKRDITILVEELEFMYGYDQTMREYTLYKTFDKSETNRIESLSDSLRIKEMGKIKLESSGIAKRIWKNYIKPKDEEHTERLIDITQKYGFPTIKRLKKYYDKDFSDKEFNPLVIFIHSPNKYWEELKILIKSEYDNKMINQCEYGYLLWHFTGRINFQPMLDNGYKIVEENGRKILKSTCK